MGWGEGEVGFGLVPVGDGGEVEGEDVGVAVFDGGAEGGFEGDWVVEEEAVVVGAAEPAEAVGDAGETEVGVVVELFGGEGGVEEVFGAGAVEGSGPGFAVDEPHVVAFAVPDRAGVIDVVVDADDVAFAFDLGKEVVLGVGRVAGFGAEGGPLVFDVVAGGLGDFAVPPGVEASEVGGEGGVDLVVDDEVEVTDGVGGLILDGEFGGPGEGHREVAVETAALVGGGGEGEGGEVVGLAPTLAEEVAEGGFDTGVEFAVPVGAEDEVAADHRVGGVVGEPDVFDDAGGVKVGDDGGFAGGNDDVVGVAPGAVETGETPGFEVAQTG